MPRRSASARYCASSGAQFLVEGGQPHQAPAHVDDGRAGLEGGEPLAQIGRFYPRGGLGGAGGLQLDVKAAHFGLGAGCVRGAALHRRGEFFVAAGEPGEALGVRRQAGADLVGEHVHVGVYGVARLLVGRAVRQRRPHRARHLAVLEMRLPEGQQFVSGLHALEAGDVAGVFPLEMPVEILGDGIAVAGPADGLDVKRVLVARVSLESVAPGEARQLVHGKTGADQRAVELVLEFPQAQALRAHGGLCDRRQRRLAGLGERPGDHALALEGRRHADHPRASCSAVSAKRDKGT